MNVKKAGLLAALGTTLLFAGIASANAGPRWDAHHPRRDQVNDRLENQNRRIRDEREDGDLTKAQARELHAEDRGIRAQERFYASQHDGHITRAEQRRLNHEENGVSKQIGR